LSLTHNAFKVSFSSAVALFAVMELSNLEKHEMMVIVLMGMDEAQIA
jgi:hypothetical protein